MDILVLFGTFILLVILTIPIGYAIGISTLVTLVCFTNMPLALITQNAITGVDSFPLMAIPFFMLAGNLMSTGGVARRIVDFCDTLLGWITGGLAIVTTLACMIFAAISGSAMATTSAIGGFMIPEMTKRGYDKAFSASLAASAGTIGVIIPPQHPLCHLCRGHQPVGERPVHRGHPARRADGRGPDRGVRGRLEKRGLSDHGQVPQPAGRVEVL